MNIKEILKQATKPTLLQQRIARLEGLVAKKGGEPPVEKRGHLDYLDSLRDMNTFLRSLYVKGFDVDHHTLCHWIRRRTKGIKYVPGCFYYAELKMFCQEPGGFGLLNKNGEPLDLMMERAREEAGFSFTDVDDFYNKILDDLRGNEVYSNWRQIDEIRVPGKDVQDSQTPF